MLSMIGLVGGLLLLIVLTIRGMNLFIAAPLCALVVAITNNIGVFTGDVNFVQTYMSGFSGFIASWFFMFLLGALFGKFMEDTGAADAVSRWIITKIGYKRAVLAVVLACAILTYGGVSVFVVAFSVYPMAVSLFKDANLPRRFIPAAMAFGSVTFTMTSAGSPEIQNWIPIKYLGTSPFAAWEVSLVVAIFMACFGYWWLAKMIRKAVNNFWLATEVRFTIYHSKSFDHFFKSVQVSYVILQCCYEIQSCEPCSLICFFFRYISGNFSNNERSIILHGTRSGKINQFSISYCANIITLWFWGFRQLYPQRLQAFFYFRHMHSLDCG